MRLFDTASEMNNALAFGLCPASSFNRHGRLHYRLSERGAVQAKNDCYYRLSRLTYERKNVINGVRVVVQATYPSLSRIRANRR